MNYSRCFRTPDVFTRSLRLELLSSLIGLAFKGCDVIIDPLLDL